MAAFGFFLPCSGYLFLAKGLDLSVLPLVIPLLFLGLFFIVSVELPDAETDRRTGKRTLVVTVRPGPPWPLGPQQRFSLPQDSWLLPSWDSGRYRFL